MDSSSVESIEENIKSIADHPFAKAAGVERSVRSAIQWLSYADHAWLLIFDNADGDPDTIGKYVPPGMRGNILFTSRNRMMGHDVLPSNAHVEVEGMTKEQAISLLLKSAMLDGSPTDIVPYSGAIVKELCYLPLAVDQAGAAIASGLCSIYDYLELYAKSRKELLALSLFRGASNYGLEVHATFEVSHKAIRDCASGGSDLMTPQAAKIALFILGIFAFFHNEIFPKKLSNVLQKNHLKQMIYPFMIFYLKNSYDAMTLENGTHWPSGLVFVCYALFRL